MSNLFFESAQGTLAFLQLHGYPIMLVLMIVEGPLVTTVAAFAASLGVFNIYMVCFLSILGNIIGDVMVFVIGRYGRRAVVDRYRGFVRIKSATIRKMEAFLRKQPGKTIAVIKVTPSLPVPGLMLAGALRLRFRTFMFYSSVVSIAYSLFFAVLGYYFGMVSGKFWLYFKRSEYVVVFLLLAAALTYFIVKKVVPRMSRRLEKI